MAGKGDKRRSESSEKMLNNWDRIFGTNSKDVDTSDVEPYHIKNARTLKLKDIEYKDKLAQEKLRKQKELFDRLDREVEKESKENKGK